LSSGAGTAQIIADASHAALMPLIHENVDRGSVTYADDHRGYLGLSPKFVHDTVDPAVEYVREKVVHTNGLENFWALFKRAVKGTHVSIEPFHLQAFVIEVTFRFDERKDEDGGRFRKVLGGFTGKRIQYNELIGHGAVAEA
jgi:hypothetical protein